MIGRNVTITLTPEASQVIVDTEKLIAEAHSWVYNGEWMSVLEPGSPNVRLLHNQLHARLTRMEHSWWTSMIGLLKLAGGTGDLHVSKEGEYALYFYQPRSGLTGALVPHWHRLGGNRTLLAEFSLNT